MATFHLLVTLPEASAGPKVLDVMVSRKFRVEAPSDGLYHTANQAVLMVVFATISASVEGRTKVAREALAAIMSSTPYLSAAMFCVDDCTWILGGTPMSAGTPRAPAAPTVHDHLNR